MQLEQLVIEARVRSGWSAIDLGVVLGRAFWLRSVALYLLLALPVYSLTMLLPGDWSYLRFLVLWWMKPVFERPILFMLSRELFADPMPLRRVLRNMGLWLKPGFLRIVTLRRFSFARSMYAPITLLEQPKAEAYSKRAEIFSSKFSSEAFWLTIVLAHFESFMVIALLAMAKLLAPEMIDVTDVLLNEEPSNEIYLDLISILVFAGIAPFYVASGFMLYIARRIEVEGWDIEMCFRDWMSQHKDAAQYGGQSNMVPKV